MQDVYYPALNPPKATKQTGLPMSSTVALPRNRSVLTVVITAGGFLANFVSFTVGAELPFIGNAFKAGNSELGILLGVFVATMGIFQVLAGFVALKWGTRETFLAGLVVAGVASLLSGLSTDIVDLIALRFVAAVGVAFTAGTAYSLVASYYAEGEKGKPIGLYFGITNGLGGVAGLPGTVALALAFGWASPMELGGAVCLIAALFSFFLLPSTQIGAVENLRLVWSRGSRVIKSRSIWALAIGLAGFQAGCFVPIDYVTQYFNQVHPSWGITTAAVLAAVGVFFTLPGGILGGRIGEKKRVERRAIVGVFAAVFGAGLIAFSRLPLEALWVWYAVAGILVGLVLTVMNIVPAYLEESRGDNLSLGIGFISSIQLLYTSVFLATFGLITVQSGFANAWIISGILTIVMLPLLLLVSPSRS